MWNEPERTRALIFNAVEEFAIKRTTEKKINDKQIFVSIENKNFEPTILFASDWKKTTKIIINNKK